MSFQDTASSTLLQPTVHPPTSSSAPGVRSPPGKKTLGRRPRSFGGTRHWCHARPVLQPKIHMEPENGPLEDDFPLQPSGFSGSMLNFQCVRTSEAFQSHPQKHQGCPAEEKTLKKKKLVLSSTKPRLWRVSIHHFLRQIPLLVVQPTLIPGRLSR